MEKYMFYYSGMSNFSTDYGWSNPTIIGLDDVEPFDYVSEPFEDSNIHNDTVNVNGLFIGTAKEFDKFVKDYNENEELNAVSYEPYQER